MRFLCLLGHVFVLASYSLGQPRGLPSGGVLTVRRAPAQQAGSAFAALAGAPNSLLMSEGLLAGVQTGQQPLSLFAEYQAPAVYNPVPHAQPQAPPQPQTQPFPVQAPGLQPVQTQPLPSQAPPGPQPFQPQAPPAQVVSGQAPALVPSPGFAQTPLLPGAGVAAGPSPTLQTSLVAMANAFDFLPNNVMPAPSGNPPGPSAQAANSVFQQPPLAEPYFPPNNLGLPNHIYQILAAQTAAEVKKEKIAQLAQAQAALRPLQQKFPTQPGQVPAQPPQAPPPGQQYPTQPGGAPAQTAQSGTAPLTPGQQYLSLYPSLAGQASASAASSLTGQLNPSLFGQTGGQAGTTAASSSILPAAGLASQNVWSSPATRSQPGGAATSQTAFPGYTPLGSIGQGPVSPTLLAGQPNNNIPGLVSPFIPGSQVFGAGAQVLRAGAQSVPPASPAAFPQVSPWIQNPGPSGSPAGAQQGAAGIFVPPAPQQQSWNTNNNFIQPIPPQLAPAPVSMVTVPPIWIDFNSFTDTPDHLKRDDPHKKNKEEEKGA